ncbi:MAG: amidohydrolase [Proteobacteria bacterium]|nr:amidohydrolase [Pseudomonadota bacterium]
MDRREFIKLSGKTIMAASALSAFSAVHTGCSTTNYRIDVHHHIVPADYVDALYSIGINDSMGKAFPEWTPNASIDVMDALNIQTAITSLTTPGVYFHDGIFSSETERIHFAANLARTCNELAARMVTDYPGRFGFFATLPMPVIDESLSEMAYALDTLNADGVGLFANYFGTFMGDPVFEELMQELNRRKAVVFLHPSPPPGTRQALGIDLEEFFLEAPIDTTRAIVNMLITGTLHRYPDIKWILSHAGGTIPYIAWRLSLMNVFPEKAANMPLGVVTYLRRLYYDTALSTSPYAMNALSSLVKNSHILFGTDWPFCTTPAALLQVAELPLLPCFNSKELNGIEEINALELFPGIS